MGAERISVTVGLDTGAIGSGIESGLAETSLTASGIDTGDSVLGRVATGARSRGN